MSHMEDVDGICSNALIMQAFHTTPVIVDYVTMMDELRAIEDYNGVIDRLFVCDLGLNEPTQDEFTNIMTRLVKKNVKVTYIDHHRIESHILRKLRSNGVRSIHDDEECTTVQVYHEYQDKLSKNCALLAACAAFTDYLDDKPRAVKLMEKFDRQFITVNATIMTYFINRKQNDIEVLRNLISHLSIDVLPADIDGIYDEARKQISLTGEMIKYVDENLKTEKNLCHIYVDEGSASGSVNFALGASDKNVAVSYRPIKDKNAYAVSVRGRRCDHHLGKITGDIATELGGLGGGHKDACGASIPNDKMDDFISQLDKAVGVGI